MDVRTLCLGLLTFGDSSGYEIRKSFSEGPLQHFFEASYGSIYPALNKLTEEGLVTCTELAQANRPDKKVYSITPAGRLAFVDALAGPVTKDKLRSEFMATIMFSNLLEPRQIAAMIDQRIKEHVETIEGIGDCCEGDIRPSLDFIRGYGLAIHKAALNYLEDYRHLVEGEAFMSMSRAAE